MDQYELKRFAENEMSFLKNNISRYFDVSQGQFNLYPLMPKRYPRDTLTIMTLESNFIRIWDRVDAKHRHPKVLRW